MSVYNPELSIQGAEAFLGDCQIEVAFRFGHAEGVLAGAELLAQVCTAFADAGRLGAYAKAGNTRYEPTLRVSELVRMNEREAGVLFTASNLDPKAFQFLRNMLGALAQLDVVLSDIRISARGSGAAKAIRLPPVEEDNESDAYPGTAITAVQFELIWSDSDFSKVRRVLVEFGYPPPTDLLQQIKPYVDAWYLLLEMGAFSAPFGLPFETVSQRGQVSLFDEMSYEISISRFISSEAGFRVLANMLGHFHRHVLPIVSVEID